MKLISKILREYGMYIAVIIAVIIIKTYMISPIIVNGDSMYSTLYDGDIMILNKMAYSKRDINRFDIVVIKYNGRHIIKRVIGLPGDTVKCEDNTLYINGVKYEEDYLDPNTNTSDFEIEEIKDGYYFVLGDNREVSMDSREIGLIKASAIEGQAKVTLFPFNRIGLKE